MRHALEAALTRRWYSRPPALALRPAAALYGGVTAVRRVAYRRRWLKSERVPVPVVAIGNLTVGGGGKTPFVWWCVARLREAGWRPAVVARGYGGQPGAEPLLVTSVTDPGRAGDEPVLLARRTGAVVVVHPDRVRAARRAIAAGADILVCDDGLQHYRLDRDLEVVLVDGRRRFGNGALLPAGPLREPVRRLREADFIVCKEPGAAPGEVPMRYVEHRAVRMTDDAAVALSHFAGAPVHAVAGIADPQGFFATLEAAGIEVIAHPLPDHHRLRPDDLAFGDRLPVLMTAKDAVKCRVPADPRLWSVEHEVLLPPGFAAEFLHRIEGLRRD